MGSLLQNLFQNMPTSYTRSCAISSQADIRANVIDPRDAPNIPANSQPPSIVRILNHPHTGIRDFLVSELGLCCSMLIDIRKGLRLHACKFQYRKLRSLQCIQIPRRVKILN